MSGKLECKRCFTAFDITMHDPRLLDCGHSVCLTCLDEMLSSDTSKVTCPFCKATTPYNKDPLSYKRNVTVVEALLPAGTNNSSDFKPKCDKCRSPSKKFCATCQKHFCTSCLEAHDYFFPRDHRIIDIEKMTPVELPAQPKIVKKPEPKPEPKPVAAEPAPALRPATGPVGRKPSISKVAPKPAAEEEPPKPVTRTGAKPSGSPAPPEPEEEFPKPSQNPWKKNDVPAPVSREPEEKEEFPKPSQNPWKKKDAAGEISAPAGPAPAKRISAKFNAPPQEKKEDVPPPAAAPASAAAPAPAPAPAEEVKSPKLPPDWAEVKDPKSGKVYYYNKKTKKTSWTPPEPEPEPEPAAAEPEPQPEPEPAADALPPGWTEAVDPRSGKTYYYNKATKETSWKKPTAAAAAPPAADELPAGWAECVDPNSGKTYYYNKATKQTSWKRPHA